MKKALLGKANARSELVRGCVDRLKQVEGRLDQGCQAGWLQGLDGVNDMLGVAEQLLPLHRLARLEDGEPVRWLHDAIGPPGGTPGAAATDDPAELSRRVLRLLDDVDRAVPPARDPVEMLGEVVLKHFEGHGTFMGTIVEYDQHTGFRVMFDDGDTEDVSLRDLRSLMPNLARPGGVPAPAAAPPPASQPSVAAAPNPRKKQLLAAAAAAASAATTGAATSSAPAPVIAISGGGSGARPGGGGGSGKSGGSKPVSRQASDVGSVSGAKSAKADSATDRGQKRPFESSGAPEKPPKAVHTAVVGGSGAGGAGVLGSIASRSSDVTPEEIAQLPAGWSIEAKGTARVYIAPDGLTRLSTLAKVQRWHKQQMALAARFQAPAPTPAPAPPPPPAALPPPPMQQPVAPVVSPTRAGPAAERRSPRSPRGAPQAATVAGASNGESRGLALPNSVTDARPAGAEATAAPPPVPAGGGGGKRLPRELRNLAMADREWNYSFAGGQPLGQPPKATIQPHGAVEAALSYAAKQAQSSKGAGLTVQVYEEASSADDVAATSEPRADAAASADAASSSGGDAAGPSG